MHKQCSFGFGQKGVVTFHFGENLVVRAGGMDGSQKSVHDGLQILRLYVQKYHCLFDKLFDVEVGADFSGKVSKRDFLKEKANIFVLRLRKERT